MWKRITEKARLAGLRFHDLRHNWATNHIESGTDLLALKELGGWRTLEMVQRYAHPSSEYLTEQAKKIDNQIKNKNEELHQATTHLLECDTKGEKSSQVLKPGTKNGTLEVIGPPQKLKNLLKVNRLIMVPEAGLEPAHHEWRRILNPLRLPIPPLWQRVH